MKTPWHDECGNLEFPYRAILDRVFIFPSPPPERLGKEKLIEIPTQFRKYYEKGKGTLLSVGPGYHDGKGVWHPTSDQLSLGVEVYYDKTVPWGFHVLGIDGEEHFVVLCGVSDVYGVIEE